MNESKQVIEHQDALIELLLQLGDDDFIYAFRGAEWLGLAPHVEEDVASASISQNSMGHAVMFYELAEELGLAEANELAHARPAHERRNSILLERVNGEGSYMGTPTYDWAYAVVRNYFYTLAKKFKMESLKTSSYEPLNDIATKVLMELHYHLMHWKAWFIELFNATEEAQEKMRMAVELAMEDFGDVIEYGEKEEEMVAAGLIDPSEGLRNRFNAEIEVVMEKVNQNKATISYSLKKNGRNREHTADLDQALATLAEVYQADPAANW